MSELSVIRSIFSDVLAEHPRSRMPTDDQLTRLERWARPEEPVGPADEFVNRCRASSDTWKQVQHSAYETAKLIEKWRSTAPSIMQRSMHSKGIDILKIEAMLSQIGVAEEASKKKIERRGAPSRFKQHLTQYNIASDVRDALNSVGNSPVSISSDSGPVVKIGVQLFAIYRGLCVTEDAFSGGVKRATKEIIEQQREVDIEAGWLVRKDAE